MPDKIKDASKILFLIAVVLYIFGFITISSFWGRFGIITFDIINARFLIAGFFSFISIAISFGLAWYVYKQCPFKEFFNPEKWSKRIIGFFLIYSFLYMVSITLTGFLNLGKYRPPEKLSILEFNYFSRFNYLGILINDNIHLSGSVDFITKTTLEIFAYVFLIVLLITAGIIVYGWLPKRIKNSPEVRSATVDKKENTESTSNVLEKKLINKYQYFLMVNLEIFAVCAFIALFIFCSLKLKTSFIDFSTIQNEPTLTANLYFSWLYVLVIVIYLFLNISYKDGNFSLSLFTKIENIDNYDNLFRQVIVPVLSATVIFGWTIYPRIPFAFGGGQPREIKVQLDKPIGFDESSKIYLLGESSQFIFVAVVDKDKSEALQINKDQIEYMVTKSNSGQD